MQSIAQIQSTIVETSATTSDLLPGGGIGIALNISGKNKMGKSTFRFAPFRKVAKSAKINLNRYWGLLSQLSLLKTETSKKSNSYMSAEDAAAFAEEMEQNRINELLEAEAYATSQNSLNNQHEVAMEILSFRSSSISSSSDLPPPTRRFVRQRCCLSQESENGNCCKDSLYSSSSSISSSVYFQETDFEEDVFVDVVGDIDNASELSFRV